MAAPDLGPGPDLEPTLCPDPVAAIVAAHEEPVGQRPLLALRTSGTSTGQPRVIRRTTASWFDSFEEVSRLSGTTARSRVWIPGSHAATMNLFAAVHAAWAGATVVDRVADATHAHLTATVLGRLVHDRPDVLRGLTVVAAGERLSAALARRCEALGAAVHHYYGAAELSFVAWGRDEESLRAFPGVAVRVGADDALEVRSPFVSVSAPAGPDGWYGVGDQGAVQADGTITVWGRPGALSVGGAVVHVARIEAELRPLAPNGLVVLGRPHPDLGQVPTAVLTRADEQAVPALRAAARTHLVPAARPRRWHVVDEWPLTEHGKIDRAALTALLTR